jgi:16S rRNA (cytosine1402-N4)-methyltransferase
VILVSRHLEPPSSAPEPTRHLPVLLEQTIAALAPARGGLFVDATLGGGGHAEALLDAGPEIRLIAVDRDAQAVTRARMRLARFGERVQFVHAPFSAIGSLLGAGDRGRVAGLLADLGLSSDQLDDRHRGFSFQQDGPLDMRMDRTAQKTSAAVLLAHASEDEIEEWLREYGEERFARRLAHAIVHQRRFGPLLRTSQLADLVARTIPRGRAGLHPATRTFQALRIAVNRELGELDSLLDQAPALLAPGGRLAVISFHSLEDRRVKEAFRAEVQGGRCDDLLPGGVRASEAEARANPRARSARLRAICRHAEADARA